MSNIHLIFSLFLARYFLKNSYLSIYLQNYTTATASHVGYVMLVSSMLGTILSLTLCSLSDRYRAHRQVYIYLLICAFTIYSLLLIPIFMTSTGQEENPLALATVEEKTNNNLTDKDLDFIGSLLVMSDDFNNTKANVEDVNDDYDDSSQITRTTPTTMATLWFAFIAICIATGSMLSDILQNFSETFSANAAEKCNQSYGSIRFFGAIGWCASSALITCLTSMDSLLRMPDLSVGFCLFCFFSLTNILVVLLWPDERPFDLSSDNGQLTSHRHRNNKQREKMVNNNEAKLNSLIQWIGFDSREDDLNRNVRRCSLAPLGDAYVIRQYELNNKSINSALAQKYSSSYSSASPPPIEFKYVTKIELNQTLSVGNNKQQHQQQQQHRQDQPTRRMETKIQFGCSSNDQKFDGKEVDEQEEKQVSERTISFADHWLVIQSIARTDSEMIRFMVMYMFVGFSVAQNWFYLFPNLQELNAEKFRQLGSLIMISGYLSETIFYYCSSWLTSRISHSFGLTAIMLFFALRYLCYLLLEWQLISMEWIILIETLQAPTMGWFSCVFSESPAKFAKSVNGANSNNAPISSSTSAAAASAGVDNVAFQMERDLSILAVDKANCDQDKSQRLWLNGQQGQKSVVGLLGVEVASSKRVLNPMERQENSQATQRQELSKKQQQQQQQKLNNFSYSNSEHEQNGNDVKLTLIAVSACCFEGCGVAFGSLIGGWLIDWQGYRIYWIMIILISLSAGLLNLIWASFTKLNLKQVDRERERES